MTDLDQEPEWDSVDSNAYQQRLEHPIRMSLHFEDVDPVATCLVTGCGWHGHGDSMTDATTAWAVHVAAAHRQDWGDDD